MFKPPVTRGSQSPHTQMGFRPLPPLGGHRREFSSPSGPRRSVETPIFSFLNESSRPTPDITSGRRFFLKDTEKVQSLEPVDMKQTPFKRKSNWEMKERFDTYEMKITSEFPRTISTVASQFDTWVQCSKDMYSLLKFKHGDSIEHLNKALTNAVALFEEMKHMLHKIEGKSKQKILQLKKNAHSLETKVMELQGASEELMYAKRLEEEQIAREIEEIFGSNDEEFHHLKQKAFTLKDIQPTGAIDILKEVYFDMTKERNIPEAKELDMNFLNPQDIENGMLENFASIQRSTATRVIKLIENRSGKVETYVQTIDEVVNKEMYDELQEQNDKSALMLQSANAQLETLREEFNKKLVTIEKIENERATLAAELAKFRRDVEQHSKESLVFRKEYDNVRQEKENLNRQLDYSANEKIRLEGKIDSLNFKIDELTETIQRNQGVIAQRDERIEHLKMKITKKPAKKEVDPDDPGKFANLPQKVVPKMKKKNEDEEYDMGIPDLPIMQARSPRKKREPRRISNEKPKDLNQKQEESSSEDSQESYHAPDNTAKTTRKHDYRKSATRNFRTGRKELNYDDTKDIDEESEETKEEKTKHKRHVKREQGDSHTKKDSLSPKGTISGHRRKDLDTSEQNADQYSDSKLVTDQSVGDYNSDSESVFREHKETSTSNRRNLKILREKKENAKQKEMKYISDNKSGAHHKRKLQESDSEDIKVNQEALERAVNQTEPHRKDHISLEIPIIQEDPSNLDKAVNVKLGSDKILAETKSIGVYFNYQEMQYDEMESRTSPTYLMPFNPNNIYGLKGDSYFHGKHQVFQASPVLPEMSDSLIFQSPYKLHKKGSKR